MPTISFAPLGLGPHAEDASVPTACAVGYDLPPATRANMSYTLQRVFLTDSKLYVRCQIRIRSA